MNCKIVRLEVKMATTGVGRLVSCNIWDIQGDTTDDDPHILGDTWTY